MLIDDLCSLGKRNDLIIFNRGYQFHDFVSFIESKDIKYLMRVSGQFFKVCC